MFSCLPDHKLSSENVRMYPVKFILAIYALGRASLNFGEVKEQVLVLIYRPICGL